MNELSRLVKKERSLLKRRPPKPFRVEWGKDSLKIFNSQENDEGQKWYQSLLRELFIL